MTLRELFIKIKAYNEVAGIIGENKIAIEVSQRVKDVNCCLWSKTCTEYKEMRRAILNTYVDYMAKALITFDEFEFNKDFEIDDCIIEIRIVDMRF